MQDVPWQTTADAWDYPQSNCTLHVQNQDKAQRKLATAKSLEHVLGNYRREAETAHGCPLCKRGFAEANEFQVRA